MQTNLTLLEPFANCVYQRNNQNIASIPVSGTVPAGTLNVKAVFTPIKFAQSDVQTLEAALPIIRTIPVDTAGNFGGTVDLPGGFYSLTVSAGNLNQTVKVGAGEVFVLFGHSFIQGGHDVANQLPATDGRVMALLDDLTTKNYQFGPLTGKIGPFHGTPDSWGQLGDKLVKRLGVPVLFYGCAYGGSNILQNWQLLTGQTRTQLPPGQTNPATRQPFEPLEVVMSSYVPKTGVRAILVEHGYNDRGTEKDTFKERFRYVFDYVRNTYNKPDLALVVVQEQVTQVPGTLADPTTAQGLAELIQTYKQTYKGPDFNATQWNGLFAQHDHLFGPALAQFASDWNTALSDTFLTSTTPYGSQSTPDVFPAVLYNAPLTSVKPVDWLLLLVAAVVLVGVYIWKKKYLMTAFLILALLALGRSTGKI